MSEVITDEQVSANTEGQDAAMVTSDLLVEDVSIDGMCGVY